MASNPKQIKMDEDASCSTVARKESFRFATSDFSRVITSPGFVDKSLLIKEILYGEEMILIAAPRRFGKSTNMDMLKKFVEKQADKDGAVIDKRTTSNYQIFKDKNLLIFQDEKFFDEHFATYPVIHACFQTVTGPILSFEKVLNGFRRVLRDAYSQHKYLLTSKIWLQRGFNINTFEKYFDTEKSKTLDIDEIQAGLAFLSECLYRHFDYKVFVLIDEYDAPINNSMFEKNVNIDHVNQLLCGIFSNTLKGNQYVERALLTGISYFATVGLSGVNNIIKYMFLGHHPFVEYYGLTAEEVEKLLNSFKIDDVTKKEVEKYYNGYVSLQGVKIFSIWSILHFLREMRMENFWEESGLVTKLVEALKFPIVRYQIEKICQDNTVDIKFIHKVEISDIIKLQKICSKEDDSEIDKLEVPDLYLSFILQQGYLTFVEKSEHKVKAPNNEIIKEMKRKIEQYYQPSYNLLLENCALHFDKISPNSDDEIFKKFITAFNELLIEFVKRISEKNEDAYHSLMFNVLCRTKFLAATELKSFCRKRPDLVVHKEGFGIVIEMKYLKSSAIALKQIIERYLKVFDDNRFCKIKEKMYIGLNVTEKDEAEIRVLVNCVDVKEAKCFPSV